MFIHQYRDAKFCVAYLEDVDPDREGTSSSTGIKAFSGVLDESFQIFCSKDDDYRGHTKASSWFDRGWTLQELIAPREVIFFQSNWSLIGTRTSLSKILAK